jgi:hypothetical protein
LTNYGVGCSICKNPSRISVLIDGLISISISGAVYFLVQCQAFCFNLEKGLEKKLLKLTEEACSICTLCFQYSSKEKFPTLLSGQ